MAASSEERFASIAEIELRRRGVTSGTGFGKNPGLRISNKIFAMLVRDELVLKLPADRVAELTSAGVGHPFDGGKGRPMKEWISVPAKASRRWAALVDEARTFVA
jgi:TfoX/Sxy family transcriptional regulator of competence genes